MSSPPAICKVTSGRHWRDFYNVRRRVYRNDSAAVLPLRSMERDQLNPDVHPFYEHARREVFLCYRGKQPVGRIAAIIDDLHNEHYGEQLGFFGFFECGDDFEVASLLLSTAESWLRDHGCSRIRGPVHPSMKSEFGVLVEGHQTMPFLMMGHSPAYYESLLLRSGFEIANEFFAFYYDFQFDIQERSADIDKRVQRILARFPKLRFRDVNRENFAATIRDINRLGNVVRAGNYGFVPLTEAELQYMIKQLSRIIRYDMIHAAYWDDRLVGFIVNVPDVNWALSKSRGPYDWMRLPQLAYWLKKTPRCRVIALGVDEEFRRKGVAMALINRLLQPGIKRFYHEWEFSWVVADNLSSIRIIQRTVPLEKYKTYRLYEKPL